MRLWRGLGARIVASSILCGLLGLFVAWMLGRHTARETMQVRFAPYIHRTFDASELARCEVRPETWGLLLDSGERLDAYDAATLRSRNAASPPLDLGLYHRLESGETAPVLLHRFGAERGTMVLRTAQSGPCSLIQATWATHSPSRRSVLYLLLLRALLVMALAAALGGAAVVVPLTRRIERLRGAASQVGSAVGYAPGGDVKKDELGELSAILDDAHARIRSDAQELEERQKALERYLSDIAHDLKTPIASLHIALEQATEQSRDPLLNDLLRASLKDVVYLSGLTENLRLACQLRDGWDPAAGSPTVDLAETVERVVFRVRYFARSRGITLDVARPDATVFVRCDATAAEQMITNLVENAVSYGNQGGHVAVLLEAHAGRFSLVVVDDGPGVEPSELPRLGERTFRSDEARQREPNGSGLGLAISSEVCTHCGWSLGFERQEPRGLKVTIAGATLPS
ncbi:MAG TPA: HAMP domain-containing sensor histidine kinase [Polyangiaceae bacterium]